ncbi:MAG: acylphosphatase [Deltaproteobacteria bacterium]|nr:acylphosphatase [Deltaproteobacteria bacterium]
MNELKKRVRLKITGRVQGVFFRSETLRTARYLNIAGWVRNCSDGSVEALLEGPTEKVDRMIDWCRRGPSLANVTSINISEEPCRGQYNDFTIHQTE